MIRRLTFALLALIATPAAAQDAAPPPATVVVAFDRETITPLIVDGLANKEAGRPVEANDPVRIASISKLIMALTALRLMDEGKVDLNRDVSDYLGWKLRSPHRHTGEVAADGADRLPPACTIPVAEGAACDLEGYVPGTSASIFSPQGGVRIGMVDLAKIGSAMIRGGNGDLSNATMIPVLQALESGRNPRQALFCRYCLAMQLIMLDEGDGCDDRLFERGTAYVGHSGDAYGLLSGLFYGFRGGSWLRLFHHRERAP